MGQFVRIKQTLIKKFPLLGGMQRSLYRFKPYRSKFRSYYHNGGWGHAESVSGPGSTLAATVALRDELPALMRRFGVRTLTDIPCGDFNWMREVNLAEVDYLGADIVPELIAANTQKYARPGIRFDCLDLMTDTLDRVDLILCRDCLFHYTNSFILKALGRIKASGSTYLLTTTFPGLEKNAELESIGLFRPVNLECPPFDLPEPLARIDERHGIAGGKVLSLWRLADLTF